MISISDHNFESEVIMSEKPVVVDFFAEWCAPCKTIEPIFENLAKEFNNKVKFVRCDVDQSPHSTSEFNIRSVPTFIFFKDGEVQDIVTGTAASRVFNEKINRMI
jgi:thioredoxin 1